MITQVPASEHAVSPPVPLPELRIPSRRILGTDVNAATYEEAADLITSWAHIGDSRYVCVATVHMLMEARDSPAYQRVINEGDFVTSDGMPLVWGLKLLGARGAKRVYGPTLTPRVCARAEKEGIPVGFYGSTPETLNRMVGRLLEEFPRLQVAYQHSPPFRALTDDEIEQEIQEISDSGARIIFVGLGCPKQEQWMAARRDRVPAVMIGVGAAFDYVAGTKVQAPPVVQSMGLEWLFRLATEPRRLWRRYLYHNPRFVVLFGLQLVHFSFFERLSRS